MMNRTSLLLMVLLLSPAVVVAQDLEAANKTAIEANEAFAAKDYAAAAEGYRKAYELSPEPPFLVAETVALDASGNCPGAVEVAERWFAIETNPPAEQLADMSRIVASCAIEDADKALAASDWQGAEEFANAAGERDSSQFTQDDVARVREAVANGRAEAALEKPVVEESDPAASGSNTQKIVGWTLVGLGGASAVFAVTQQLAFNKKSDAYDTAYAAAGCDEARPTCSGTQTDWDEAEKLRKPAATAKTMTIVGWSAAGVLGAAGLGMVLLSGNGAEVSWVPPAGASVSVRF